MKLSDTNKISIFLPSFEYGGAEKNLINLANYLHGNNYIIELLVVNDKGLLKDLLNPEIKIINFNKTKSFYSIFKLIKYFNKNNPDFHFSSIRNLNILSILASYLSFRKVKIIIRESNVYSDYNVKCHSISYKIFKLMSKYMYPLSYNIIAVSEAVKESLMDELKINSQQIITIYNPINSIDIFEKSRENIEDKFNSKDSKFILAVGSLTKQKNYDLLLKAFHDVLKTDQAYLLIIGDGPEKNRLIKLSKTLKISNNTFFYGTTNNPYKYMYNCNIFVLPSLWEGFPNVLLEAIACQSRIVATNCKGGTYEILKNYKYGTIVKNNNIYDLSFNLRKFLNAKKILKDPSFKLTEYDINIQFKEYDKLIN